jgi:hypothetical protein
MKEFFCYSCKSWIDESIHRQHHHNDPDTPDQIRDPRERIAMSKFQIAQLDKAIQTTAYKIKANGKAGIFDPSLTDKLVELIIESKSRR